MARFPEECRAAPKCAIFNLPLRKENIPDVNPDATARGTELRSYDHRRLTELRSYDPGG